MFVPRTINFTDRKPSDRPVLCTDGKLRLPQFTTPNMIETNPKEALKAYGAFYSAA